MPRTPPQWSPWVCEIDHRRDRQALADMLLEELAMRRVPVSAVVSGSKTIQPVAAAHEGDVREVEAAHLIDAGHDLVEPVVVVEPADPMHRRVDAVEFVRLSRNWNCSMSQATWPASAMIFISGIGAIRPRFCSSRSRVSAKGRRPAPPECSAGVKARAPCPRVEMPRQRRLLGARRAAAFDQHVAGDGEGGAQCRNGSQELTSRRHRSLPSEHRRAHRGAPLDRCDTEIV